MKIQVRLLFFFCAIYFFPKNLPLDSYPFSLVLQQNSSIGKRMSDILSAHNDAPIFQDQKGSSPLEQQQRSPLDVSNPSAQPNTTSFEAAPSVNVKRHSRSLDLPVSDMKDSEWSGIRHQRSNSDTISKDIPSVATAPYMEVSTSPGLAPEPLASALPASPLPTGNSSIFGIALGRKQPFGARKQSLRGIEVNIFFFALEKMFGGIRNS